MVFLCNSWRFVLCCICTIILASIGFGSVEEHVVFGAVIFLTLAVVFLCFAVVNGAIIRIDEDTISMHRVGRKKLIFAWPEVAEVAVVNKKYVYCSKNATDEKERMEIFLHWPAKDKICFRKNKKAMQAFVDYYGKGVAEFSSGKIKIM